jgi:hypothetical protein
MLKTVKAKIVAGVLTATIVSGGVGAVFASTDAGQQLKSWYDGQFSAKATEVTGNVMNYGKGLVPGLVAEKNTLKTNSVGEVATAGTDEETARIATIDSNLKDYESKITSMTTNINQWTGKDKGYMFEDLQKLRQDLEEQIDSIADPAISAAKKEILDAIDSQAVTSLDLLATRVGEKQSSAEKTLTEAIAGAKDAITSQLNTQGTKSENEVKTYLDDKINAARTNITKEAGDLVGEKKAAITNKGKELQDAALNSLDNLVKDITK